jgi:uncharacterized FAD-dependent dehydrogenase
VPRAHAKKAAEGRYKDRAAMRRDGDAGEFKNVTALMENFEKRKADAGADAEAIEAQRAHLGGDAEHSVLVKGLDFALLARRKAELERERLEKMDDEIEDFGREIKAQPKVDTKDKGKDKSKDKGKSKSKDDGRVSDNRVAAC